jgi:ATP citrate (pro-S)-lyase
MSQKAIREYDGKRLLASWMSMNNNDSNGADNAPAILAAQVAPDTDMSKMADVHPWLLTHRLVVKPDQLIKRRGKANLLALNITWKEAQDWVAERRGKPVTIEGITGLITHFLVEPFVPHGQVC